MGGNITRNLTTTEKIALILSRIDKKQAYRLQAEKLVAEMKLLGLYVNEARNDPSGRWGG